MSLIDPKRIAGGFKLMFRMLPPGRNLKIYPDDTFVISYPKSGNTWTRFLIANLVYPDTPATFANINDLVIDPDGTPKGKLEKVPRPRVLNTFYCFDPRYPRVIYIVRDPRDVAVSQFHFHRKRKVIGDDFPIEQFITRYLAGETSLYGGSWGEHVVTWIATRYGKPNFLLLRYEDMMSQTEAELAKAAKFLGIEPAPDRLATAVQRSSAEEMRKLEKAGSDKWTTTRESRKDIAFVREAKAGGWKTSLPAECVERIEAAWGPIMRFLGYELSTSARNDDASAKLYEAALSAANR